MVSLVEDQKTLSFGHPAGYPSEAPGWHDASQTEPFATAQVVAHLYGPVLPDACEWEASGM